jgi:hypothetical protein
MILSLHIKDMPLKKTNDKPKCVFLNNTENIHNNHHQTIITIQLSHLNFGPTTDMV